MGNKHCVTGEFGNTSDGKKRQVILPKKTRKVVTEVWPQLMRVDHSLVERAWLRVCEEQIIKEVLGIDANTRPCDSQTLQFVMNSTEELLHRLILSLNISSTAFVDSCQELGARHVRLANNGFKVEHIDYLKNALIDCFHESMSKRGMSESAQQHMRLFFECITDNMKYGFLDNLNTKHTSRDETTNVDRKQTHDRV